MTQLCRSFTAMQWVHTLVNSTGGLRTRGTSNSLWDKNCISLDKNVSLWMYTFSSHLVTCINCPQVIPVYLTTPLEL